MRLKKFFRENRFHIISWLVTLLLSAGILGGGLWYKGVSQASALVPEPTAQPGEDSPDIPLPASTPETVISGFTSIVRTIQLKTNIPERPRYHTEKYTVARGDSVFAISEKFNVEPETVLWANYDVLQDNPHNLKPGMELLLPPTNGIYYQWKDGDTLEAIANEYEAEVDDILGWPGNDIDLTNPKLDPGSWVMIPGGAREFVQWLIPTIATGASGTSGTSGGGSCPGGAVGSGAFVWPADNHFLSGNDYWSGHLAIDIAAGEGAPIYAADSGVVTMAQGGDNYGYGNVIQIDHGNGYSTLYAHLSVIGVGTCESVYAGQWIGGAGNTGNSQGAHLHFEVRQGGGFINPWYVLP